MKLSNLALTTAVIASMLWTAEASGQDQSLQYKSAEGAVHFAPGVKIPPAPQSLAIFHLNAQKAPIEFVRQLLPSVAPESKELLPLAESPLFRELKIKPRGEMLGAIQGKHVSVLVDPASGDVEVFPSITLQKPVATELRQKVEAEARNRASEIFGRADIIAKDPTRTAIGNLISVYGATLEHRPGARAMNQLYMVYVPLRRFVGSYPVYGLGSRATVALAADGKVHAFVRRWKLAAPQGQVSNAPKPEEVQKAIMAQLSPLARRSEVTVNSVKLAYYDGNREYLQPVYRFTARVHALGKTEAPARTGADNFLIGYTPIGKALEPLPVPGKASGATPAFPKGKRPAGSPPAGDPTVGRYVVRNDDDDWVNDANEFMDGLNSMPYFTDSQYFWAEPFEFLSDPGDFINSVQLALVEVHGNWWGYSTIGNSGDWVDMTTIAAPGYGNAAGGHLAYWVIHSCEVIPSPDDTPNWPDPWWNIFGGLHSVVGYRTIMWIDDDVGGPYGNSLA